LYLTLRSRGGKNQRGYAFSRDGGQTWSPVQYDPRLTEPDCQGSIIRLERGSAGKSAILLANPASTAGRKELTVRMSEDDARTWPVVKIVEWDMAAYSDLAVTRQGEVLLLYEADDYRKLILIRFNLAWLTDAGAPNRVVWFDENLELIAALNQGGGAVEWSATEHYARAGCLRVTPVGRYAAKIKGWRYRIRENPGPGEYRYLRLAWKSAGAFTLTGIAPSAFGGPALFDRIELLRSLDGQ